MKSESQIKAPGIYNIVVNYLGMREQQLTNPWYILFLFGFDKKITEEIPEVRCDQSDPRVI